MDDDVYQSRQDPAITVGFRVSAPDSDLDGAHLLIWTTTPWTLPSNQAVAVNPDVTYVLVRVEDRRFVLAQARLAAYARELGEEPEILATLPGEQLLGLRYLPPFPYFLDSPNAFQVLRGDFVTTEDGTGIVHMAPAYGEDDKATTDTVGIVPVTPVDSKGRFDATVPDYQGQHVFDANPQIIRDLKSGSGPAAVNAPVLIRHETYDHSYPHCWRCRNPLIYRAVSSWFVKVTEFRDRMVELNQQITWYPEHVRTASSASGCRVRGTGRSRGIATGAPRFRFGSPTIPPIRASTSMAVSTNSNATSASVRAICTDPTSTNSPGPIPMTRAVFRRCAASKTSSTCGSTRVDALRPGALPVRERRLVPDPQPG